MQPTIYKPSIYNGNGIYKNGASGGGGENIDDYLLLEYITQMPNNSGSNYFSIPFETLANDYFELTFMLDNNLYTNSVLPGFSTNDGLGNYIETFLQYATNNITFCSFYNSSGYQYLGTSFTKGRKYKITRNNFTIEKYDVENDYHEYFAVNNSGFMPQKYIQIIGDGKWPTYNTKTRIYGFVLKRDGVTLMNLFPVVKRSDGVTCGLFDIINNVVYYTRENQSTSFTPGQVL